MKKLLEVLLSLIKKRHVSDLFKEVKIDKLFGKIDHTTNMYTRFPDSLISQEAWDIKYMQKYGVSQHSSGLFLSFETNSSKLVVEFSYDVIGEIADIPDNLKRASAFDLYEINNSEFIYIDSFDGTNIKTDSGKHKYELKLQNNDNKTFIILFPSYSKVADFNLFIQKKSYCKIYNIFSDIENDRILIYGTSIVQGSCATRPGLSHTWLMSKKLKREIINMGVAGSAFVSDPMINFLITIPVQMLFIDVGYNFYVGKDIDGVILEEDFVKMQLIKLISQYRLRHIDTPIILVEPYKNFKNLNKNIYKDIKRELSHIKNIYVLPIDQDISVVDHVHPDDKGMQKIVLSYIDLYLKITKT